MVHIPTEELHLLHTNICQAVGDVKRLEILYALHQQPMHVTALAELLETPQSTISRHLGMLRQRGLVVGERDGTAVVYRVTVPRLIEVMNMMRQVLRDVMAQQSGMLEER